MSKYDLSILIPARNEEFISNTVADIVKNKRGKTEVIVGLDGEWANPGIMDHPDVRVVYVSESIGQRAMTNKLCKLSRAKYVAKTDAHCAFDEGFDVKLMDGMQDDWTVVPVMRNLHAFSWVCEDCGHETYQGPVPEGCANTGCPAKKYSFRKEVKWIGKTSPQSTAYLFNRNLQFWYFSELKKRQNSEPGKWAETMSLQGSFFMLTRKKYWELNICDESWGSWGQQGTEVALKTWLSGGRVLCNKDTWYAHMFRTQNGFSFPYPMSGSDQRKARKISRDLFLNNKWPLQVRNLSWVLDRFWPELQQYAKHADAGREAWRQEDLDKLKASEQSLTPTEKGIIYYTDNQLKLKIARKAQDCIREAARAKQISIVSCSLKPMDNMGKNVRLRMERGVVTMLTQILTALENSTAEYIFFTEHDVLYHPTHFDFTPPTKDKFYYNRNVYRIRGDGLAATWEANQVAQLCCSRELAVQWYKDKIKRTQDVGFDRSYEPGGRDESQFETWRSGYPNIDIRHDSNLTQSKWSVDDFRDKSTAEGFMTLDVREIPGWNLADFRY